MLNETQLNNTKKINPIGMNHNIISELKSNSLNKGRNPGQFYIKRNPATSGEKTIFHSKNLSFANINLCRPGQKKILHGIENMDSNHSINYSNINKSIKIDESTHGTQSSQSNHGLQTSLNASQANNYNTLIVNNLNNLNLNTHNYSFNTGANSICATPVNQKINLNYNYLKQNQSNTSLLKGEGKNQKFYIKILNIPKNFDF
jgi:hypothetical protein